MSNPPLAVLPYPSVAEYRALIAATNDGTMPLEPYQLVSQNDLEPVLVQVLEETPNVAIRFGCELTGLSRTPAA